LFIQNTTDQENQELLPTKYSEKIRGHLSFNSNVKMKSDFHRLFSVNGVGLRLHGVPPLTGGVGCGAKILGVFQVLYKTFFM
jgi:hypothetical protein